MNLAHINLASFLWDMANSAIPDQTPQMRHLISFSTVSLQKFLFKFESICKLPPNNPKIGNGLVQLIRIGNTFGINVLNAIKMHLFICSSLKSQKSNFVKQCRCYQNVKI